MSVRIATKLPAIAENKMPTLVSGKTFASLEAFKRAIGSGHAVLTPGTSVKIKLGKVFPGGLTPKLVGMNKRTAFTSSFNNATGRLTITTKPTAKIGDIDRVSVRQGPLVAPSHEPKGTRSTLTLEVGVVRAILPRSNS